MVESSRSSNIKWTGSRPTMTSGRIFVHDAPKHAIIPWNVSIQNFECPSPVVRLSSVRLSVRQSVRLSGRVGSARGAYLKAPFRASQSASQTCAADNAAVSFAAASGSATCSSASRS